jgi:hypothetical protein
MIRRPGHDVLVMEVDDHARLLVLESQAIRRRKGTMSELVP